MSSARVRYVGVAEESVFGQEPTAITSYVDVASSSLDTPDTQAIFWQGVSERAAVVHAPGAYIPSGDIVAPVDAVMIGYLLKWTLGQVSTTRPDATGAPDVRRHTFTPANQLQSFTAAVGKDIFEHRFIGCVVDSMELSVEDEFATVTASIVARQDRKATLATPTFSDVSYFTFAQTIATVGTVQAPVESLTLSIANNADGEAGVRLGSRFPAFIAVGAREVTVSMDLTFEDTTHLEKFWGAPSGPVDIPTQALTITMTGPPINASPTHNYRLEFTLPRVVYQTSNQEISARDRIVQSVEGRALFDRTVGYDIQAVLMNAQPSY